MVYLYTLDSHMCFGPFSALMSAHTWAKARGFSTYELMPQPPFEYSEVLNPITHMPQRKRWYGKVPATDSFGDTIHIAFVDGATDRGPWALMTPRNHTRYGRGLGVGRGQMYIRSVKDNVWYKVEHNTVITPSEWLVADTSHD